MKKNLIAAIFAFAFMACKKDQIIEHKKETYTIRVEAKGDDGSAWYSNEAYYANANGGQAGANEFTSLSYAGYTNGYYVLYLQNKQACGIDFTVQWLGMDTTIYLAGSATATIQLPGAAKGDEKIRAKPLYKCGTSGGDMGWVEVITPISLPLKFKGIRWEEVGKGKLKIVFDVAECSGINVFNVQLRIADGTFKNVGVVFPDDTKPNATYTLTIQL